MVPVKITTIALIAILIPAWLVFFVTQMEAETTDEQKQALIGEWRGYFRCSSSAPSTPGSGISTVYNPNEWTVWDDGTQRMWYNAVTGEQLPAGVEPWVKYPSATGVQPTISAELAQTLIIHEIDTAKAKARCTYTDPYLGGKKYPVLADFISGPEPKLEFKVEGNKFQFVLKENTLQGAFKGMRDGFYVDSTVKMEKYPKK